MKDFDLKNVKGIALRLIDCNENTVDVIFDNVSDLLVTITADEDLCHAVNGVSGARLSSFATNGHSTINISFDKIGNVVCEVEGQQPFEVDEGAIGYE